MTDVVIVGGGLSGILTALKLSLSEKYKNKSITIIEEKPSLGGRLFFASPCSFFNKSRMQIQEELFQNAHSNKSLSGFGFEIFDLQTKEIIFRHIQNSLTTEENNDLEAYLSRFKETDGSGGNCYFIKKEITTSQSLLNGSSELLTKKEAEYLNSLLVGETNTQNTDLQSKIWNDLSKQAKESLSQLFETIIGGHWEDIAWHDRIVKLKEFFLEKKENNFLPFQRNVALEIFLEKLLINRGIEIRNLCKLLRVQKADVDCFSLTLSDEIEPENKYLQTKQLVLAIPLAKCAGILPKEMLLPEQSKFISRIQPLSLVVYELANFSKLKSSDIVLSLKPYDKLVFPVERAKAFYSADDRLLLYAELDYEESMQAPAVREAVGRLKRAASRLLHEDLTKELKKGFRMPQNVTQSMSQSVTQGMSQSGAQSHFSERVILLPVAQSVHVAAKINFDLKQVNMGVANLYCCGDSFFSLANEPWKRVIHSVNDIAHLMH